MINAVSRKKKHPVDDKPINLHQKPLELLSWMVTHFSHADDWIIDACSGSGVGWLAALEKGRHVVAVEIDQRQVDTWEIQLLKLETDLQSMFKENVLSKEDNDPSLKDRSIEMGEKSSQEELNPENPEGAQGEADPQNPEVVV